MVKRMRTSGYDYPPSNKFLRFGALQEHFYVEEGTATLAPNEYKVDTVPCTFEVGYSHDYQVRVIAYFDPKRLPALKMATNEPSESAFGSQLPLHALNFTKFTGISQPEGYQIEVYDTGPMIPTPQDFFMLTMVTTCNTLKIGFEDNAETFRVEPGSTFALVGCKQTHPGRAELKIKGRTVELVQGTNPSRLLNPEEGGTYLCVSSKSEDDEDAVKEIADAVCLVLSLVTARDINWTWFENRARVHTTVQAQAIRFYDQRLIAPELLRVSFLFQELDSKQISDLYPEFQQKRMMDQAQARQYGLNKLAEAFLDLAEPFRSRCRLIWGQYAAYSQFNLLPSLEGNLRLVTSLTEELLYAWGQENGNKESGGLRERLKTFFNRLNLAELSKKRLEEQLIEGVVLTRDSIMHYGLTATYNEESVRSGLYRGQSFSEAIQTALEVKELDAGPEIQTALGFLPLMMYALLNYEDFESLLTRYPFAPD